MPDPLLVYLNIFLCRMCTTLNLIKESFESWYNERQPGNPISVVANYSDTQPYSIKAFHQVCLEMQIEGIETVKSYIQPVFTLKENYNHGETTEEEAKSRMLKKLLMELYGYWS